MSYFLIGEKLSHSRSEELHRLFGFHGYSQRPLEKNALADFLCGGEFDGLNVTIPYKTAVIPFMSELDGDARECGAVNTVVRRGSRLVGCNTDLRGFLYMTDRAGIEFCGKKVLVTGSGGASRAACAAVARRGGICTVISRGGEDNYGNISRHADADIIVNATPVGMFPNDGECPVDISFFPALSAVVDMIYNPLSTRLLLDAKARGIKCAGGLSMLVAQGAYAEELFGSPARSGDEIERVFAKMRVSGANIIIIGMPGAGKDSVGARAAEICGRRFISTDDEIKLLYGKKPSKIIEERGEAEFRKIEAEACARICENTRGAVIATGGGTLTSRKSADALAKNGVFVFIDRDISLLTTDDRPLSAGEGALSRLYAERLPIYEKYADFTVGNNGDIESAARAVALIAEERRI